MSKHLHAIKNAKQMLAHSRKNQIGPLWKKATKRKPELQCPSKTTRE